MGRIMESLSLSNWFDNGVLTSKRIIYMENSQNINQDYYDYSEVHSSMSSKFIKSMYLLESLNKDPITVIVNTPGGDEYAMFAIYDRIKQSPCHITVRGYGQIMSAGTVIMQAADERQVTPESWYMIHRGYNSIIDQSPQSVRNWSKAYNKIAKRIYEIYLEKIKEKHDNYTLKKIENMCVDDIILNANETVELGLADKIYKGE